MNTLTCVNCGALREYEPIMFKGRELFRPRFCAPCVELEERRAEEAKAALKMADREKAWAAICPPAYRTTDRGFPLMNQALLSGLLKYEAKEDGRGLGLYGATGQRKTRMMFLVLERLHFAGHSVYACSSKRIAACFAAKYGKDRASDEAREVIGRCYRAEVLFLDDLGKQRFSEAGESEFFDLIEHRTSHLKPILWTANASGDELARMMSPDRGGPIVRRLEDFCEVIGV